MKEPRIVEVTWEDAASFGGDVLWPEVNKKAPREAFLCKNVGYLAYKGPDLVVISPSRNREYQGSMKLREFWQIPTSLVRKIRYLR